jgi:hypothetical protein
MAGLDQWLDPAIKRNNRDLIFHPWMAAARAALTDHTME